MVRGPACVAWWWLLYRGKWERESDREVEKCFSRDSIRAERQDLEVMGRRRQRCFGEVGEPTLRKPAFVVSRPTFIGLLACSR